MLLAAAVAVLLTVAAAVSVLSVGDDKGVSDGKTASAFSPDEFSHLRRNRGVRDVSGVSDSATNFLFRHDVTLRRIHARARSATTSVSNGNVIAAKSDECNVATSTD